MDMDTRMQAQHDPEAITQVEYAEIFEEIEEQPKWRATADKEADYADGNQLDGELLRKQQELGIPPAIENLIGPSLLSIQGYEAITRTDWRVTPNGQPEGQDVADALNFKLNEAERHSKADDACSEAFRPQITCGLGWVEVKRESDPFRYPYRCLAIHRNEIHWDMNAIELDLSDARWLRRQRWMTPDRVARAFPQHAELIKACGRHGPSWWAEGVIELDGGSSTGLRNAWNEARAWTMQEDRWFNPSSKEICVAELWYRRWVTATIIRTPDGRVVEYDENNQRHVLAVAQGMAEVERAIVTRVRRSFWLGPHLLHDGPTPYPHRHFPYVPFFGFREDTTRVPFGYVRSMKYAQDSLNSGISKLRWGMSVTRVERTKGAVDMTDAQLRRQVARPDADIVLNAQHMAAPGARFEVKRDYQLTDQHYQMLQDNRAAIERVSTVTAGFMGKQGTARSGIQEQTQVEQSNQSLGKIMSSFRSARTQVGELLLSLIVQDIGSKESAVVIEGDAITPDRTVILNAPEADPQTGLTYLSNDLLRTRLQVGLEDVPTSNTYRGQQLNALSEAIKSLPAQYQAAAMPFLASLMDVPFKRPLIEALRKASEQEAPEAVEKRVRQEVANELKARELELKERRGESEVKEIEARSVQIGVQAAFSAMQAGAQIAQMPLIAPIADVVMQGAGYRQPNPMGDDPNFPQPVTPSITGLPGRVGGGVSQNTSPIFPPVPDDGSSPMRGIETSSTDDNNPSEVE